MGGGPMWAGIAAVYFLLRLNLLPIPFDRDEGFFGYGGQVLLRGGALYRDMVDHKPPLVFYLYSLILRVLPPTPLGVHVFLHAYNFLTTLALYRLARRWVDRGPARSAALAYAVVSSAMAVQGFTASTEMFLLLPLTLAAWFSLSKSPSPTRSAAAGALAAVALWIKSQAAPAAFFIGWGILVAGFRAGGVRLAFRRGLGFLAGAAATTGLVLWPFCRAGFLADLGYWAFSYNRLYAQGAGFWSTSVPGTVRNLGRLFLEHPGVLVLAAIGLGAARDRQKINTRWPAGFALFSFLGVLPGYAFPHYLALLAPSLALLAGVGWKAVEGKWKGSSAGLRTAVLFGALAVVPGIFHSGYYFRWSGEETSLRVFDFNPFVEADRVARYLKTKSAPGDRLFVVGSEPEVLLASELPSATRWVNMGPLLTSRVPDHPRFQRECLGDIDRSPPEWVVLFDSLISLPADGGTDPAFLREVRARLAASYRRVAVVPTELDGGRLIEVDPEGPLPPRSHLLIYRRADLPPGA